MDILSQDIMYLSGVGPHKKDTLVGQLGIKTWGDLLEYYPYKYVDRSKVYRISDLTGDMPFVQIKGKFSATRCLRPTVATNAPWPTSPTGMAWPTWCGSRVGNTP